jgi:hypothetical protein
MVNYMYVRSIEDPVKIIGERDNLAINCDLSEVHSCNHTCSGYAHEHVKTRQFEFIVRIPIVGICAEEAGCLETELAHVFVEFCMTV